MKLLLLVSLLAGLAPSGATEMVCVLGSGQTIVPVAACKVACCAHCPLTEAAPVVRDCCPPKAPAAKKDRPPGAICELAGMSCRCELRFVAGSPRTIGWVKARDGRSFDAPMALPAPIGDLPLWVLVGAEAGIVGIDLGPPRKLPRRPEQPRAPPVLPV